MGTEDGCRTFTYKTEKTRECIEIKQLVSKVDEVTCEYVLDIPIAKGHFWTSTTVFNRTHHSVLASTRSKDKTEPARDETISHTSQLY